MNFIFSLSLIIALTAVLLSLLSEKYWTKEREKAVLINVGGADYFHDGNNRCNCETIDLTAKYYQAEFGGSGRPFDGITIRAVIEGQKPYEILAKVFLSDSRFVVNGNISIIHRSRFDGKIFYYDAKKEKKYINAKEDIGLFDYDLIFIKDDKNSIVASFLFLLVESIDDDKIYNNRIVVESQEPETAEVEQNAE